MSEVWLPYKGYEEHYEVSDLGNVRSLSRLTDFGSSKKFVLGRVLKIKCRKGKYPFVILSKDNAQSSKMIHRLVAETHIQNPLNLPEVNHKDGNKNNNAKDNLEWATRSYNQLHAYDTGLLTLRKLTREDVLSIRSSSLSDNQLSKKFNVRPGNIWNVRNRKSWQHVQ